MNSLSHHSLVTRKWKKRYIYQFRSYSMLCTCYLLRFLFNRYTSYIPHTLCTLNNNRVIHNTQITKRNIQYIFSLCLSLTFIKTHDTYHIYIYIYIYKMFARLPQPHSTHTHIYTNTQHFKL